MRILRYPRGLLIISIIFSFSLLRFVKSPEERWGERLETFAFTENNSSYYPGYDQGFTFQSVMSYKSDFSRLSAILTNDFVEGPLMFSKSFILLRKFNDDWKIIKSFMPCDDSMECLELGSSYTYTILRDDIIEDLELIHGTYRIVTTLLIDEQRYSMWAWFRIYGY